MKIIIIVLLISIIGLYITNKSLTIKYIKLSMMDDDSKNIILDIADYCQNNKDIKINISNCFSNSKSRLFVKLLWFIIFIVATYILNYDVIWILIGTYLIIGIYSDSISYNKVSNNINKQFINIPTNIKRGIIYDYIIFFRYQLFITILYYIYVLAKNYI